MKMTSLRYFPALLMGFCFFFPSGFYNAEVFAQQKMRDVYEGIATVQVKRDNYVAAREKAVHRALKNGLEVALQEMLGDEEFEASQRDLRKILRRASHYVKSYHFLDAYDDLINKTSDVRLEMRFFSAAVTQALAGIGVIAGPVSEHKVALLIDEKSFTSALITSFWGSIPISETQLANNLIEDGIEVMSREELREIISEETVLGAIKGNLSFARKIGLKAGADIVIVGTAVSKLRGENSKDGTKIVQANINVKVVSTLESSLIAAKTEFSTIKHEHALQAELQAFDIASKKLADFLTPSFHRYWEKGIEVPVKKDPGAPPMSMSDM